MAKGQLNLSLSFSATYTETGHVETCPDIGPECPVASQWHDLRLFFSDLRIHAEYGFADWLSLDLLLPLRLVHVDFQLQDAATRQPISGSDIHHRTETVSGLGDLWLSLRAIQQLGEWGFAFRLGATLPSGSTVENPFALGREGLTHQHIQFGTGTVDPFVGVELQRAIRRFVLAAWTLGKFPLYENSHGYRGGGQWMGGLDLSSDLWTRRWTFTLGALAYHEEAERWNGVVETEGNLGRTDLMLDTAVAWRFTAPWTVSLGLRVPFFTEAVGGQLNTPAIGLLTLSRSVH